MVSTKARWSGYVAIYTFVVGVALLVPLGVAAKTIIKVLGFQKEFTTILVPGTGAVLGATVWWAVVERWETYTYLRGGIVGLMTASLAVLFWVLFGALIYGPAGIIMAGPVIVFVLGIVTPVAVIAWLPLMYARRHLTGVEAEGERPAIG